MAGFSRRFYHGKTIMEFDAIETTVTAAVAGLAAIGLAIWGPKLLARYGKGFISIFTR